MTERRQRFPKPDEFALFLNPGGRRLSIRSIDLALRRLGEEADVAVSAHTLRHSCLTNLVRRGHDLVLVAEIAGKTSLISRSRLYFARSAVIRPVKTIVQRKSRHWMHSMNGRPPFRHDRGLLFWRTHKISQRVLI